MGNSLSINKVNYEDIEYAINNKEKYILINTLPENMQNCLIFNTIPYNQEETIINHLLTNYIQKTIIVYGKNNHDKKVLEKYNQLSKLGFRSVYIYFGGMFEWILLQDIYGDDHFQTTSKEFDILKFRPERSLSKLFLTS